MEVDDRRVVPMKYKTHCQPPVQQQTFQRPEQLTSTLDQTPSQAKVPHPVHHSSRSIPHKHHSATLATAPTRLHQVWSDAGCGLCQLRQREERDKRDKRVKREERDEV